MITCTVRGIMSSGYNEFWNVRVEFWNVQLPRQVSDRGVLSCMVCEEPSQVWEL